MTATERTSPHAAARKLGLVLLGACCLPATPARGAAQIAWESPMMVHPHAPHGWSVLLAEPWPGNEVAVIASWRTAPVPVGFGVRLGLGEGVDGDLALFGGADASGELVVAREDVPFDLVWVLGGGASVSDDVLVSIPAALMAGWDIRADAIAFQPWVGPRLVLDAWIGGRERGEGDNLNLEATLEVGVDLLFAGGWTARFGATLANREAIAVGVALPAVGSR